MFLLSCTPPSDYRELYVNREEEKDKFFASPLVFYDSDSSKPRLDLSVEIPISNISFQKNFQNQTYYSKIIITVNIKNSTGEIIISKSYSENSTYGYEEIKAKSKGSQYYFYNYFLYPGSYKVEVEINDDYARNINKKTFDVTVKDFGAQETTISDLMLLSKVNVNDDGTKDISPLIRDNVFGLKELFVFFEVYNFTGKEIPKEYSVKLKNNKGVVLKELMFSYNLSPGKNQKFESIFILADLRKQIPEDTKTDFREKTNKEDLSFTLEVLDKSNNKTEAQKKLMFLPDKPHPQMMNRPPQR